MKKNIQLLFSTALLSLFFTGCSITLPVAATSNEIGPKVGTATATGYFGVLFFDQDASIQTAAKNGGITKISTVDIRRKDVLGIITTFETIVTGN